MEDLYCKLYIDSEFSKHEMLNVIAGIIGGTVSVRTIDSDFLEISVISNEDHDKAQSSEKDGFVYYPYYCEIEPPAGVDSNPYKTALGGLITSLQGQEMSVVASCDFEDDLPKSPL